MLSERDRLEIAAGMSGVVWHYQAFDNPEALRIVRLIEARIKQADHLEERIRVLEVEKARVWDLHEHLVTKSDTSENHLRSKLRILADGLFKSASGTLEGPDIEDLLEKAGLIEWVIFDSENPDHTLAYFDYYFDFEVEDGDRVWLTTDFADELLKHEDLPASPSESAPGSTAPSSPSEAPGEQTPPVPE